MKTSKVKVIVHFLSRALFFCGLLSQAGAQEAFSPRDWNFSDPSLASRTFTVPLVGSYRWEVVSPSDPVFELSIAEQTVSGGKQTWAPLASNRNLRGGLDRVLEAPLNPGKTYLFAILLPDFLEAPVRVEMTKSHFASLRDALQKDLSSESQGYSPLRERWSSFFPIRVSQVSAAWGDSDELFLGFADSEGKTLQVWSTSTHSQLGSSLAVRNGVLNEFSLTTNLSGNPLVVYSEQGNPVLQTRFWNTIGWVEVPTNGAGAPFALVKNSDQIKLIAEGDQGLEVFTWNDGSWSEPETAAGPLVGKRLSAAFWKGKIAVLSPENVGNSRNRLWLTDEGRYWSDTNVPQTDQPASGEVVGGDEVLWTLLKDSDANWKLYQFTTDLGWQVLSLPTTATSWKAFSDGPGLRLLAQGPRTLALFRWDGLQWSQGLNLLALTNPNVVPVFLPPAPGEKQGTLLLCAPEKDRVGVRLFDLP